MTVTDEDIEYVVLLAIQCEVNLNRAIHIMLDNKAADSSTNWQSATDRERTIVDQKIHRRVISCFWRYMHHYPHGK